MPVTRRTIDGDACILQLLASGVDVIDHIGEMAEIAAARIGLRIPVEGEFQFRRPLCLRPIRIGGRSEKNQREAAFVIFSAADFFKAEFVYIKIERFVDVANSDHRVQIAHSLFLGCCNSGG